MIMTRTQHTGFANGWTIILLWTIMTMMTTMITETCAFLQYQPTKRLYNHLLLPSFLQRHHPRGLQLTSKQKNTDDSSNPRQQQQAPSPSQIAEFEYQELKIQLNAMQRQQVKSIQLTPDKRQELEGYVRRIVRRRPSSIPLVQIATYLPQTTWALVFTTQALTAELPRDATIVLTFQNDRQMDYSLVFSKKTLGLNRIVAKSTYAVDVRSCSFFRSWCSGLISCLTHINLCERGMAHTLKFGCWW